MKKILLSLLLAGTVQNSFAMGSCGGGAAQGGGQAAESSSRLEGQVPVVFEDGLVVYLDLQRLKALNSCLLESILFTADGLSGFGKSSEDNKLVMEEFSNLADFESFETALKRPLQGEIADMVDFFKKADFLGINTDDNLKRLRGIDEAQFFKLCRALLEENPGFVFNMQRVYPEILHYAIKTQGPDFAKMLIEAGADVNAKDRDGKTVLMCAATTIYTEIAQLLIAAGADVNASDMYGRTALMEAANRGTEIVQLLIDANANVNASDNQGITALMLTDSFTGTAQLLIAAGANVNARSNGGRTALIRAAKNNYTKMVQLLIAAGADVHASESHSGLTALMCSASDGHTEIILLLIHAGVNVNARDSDGETALMYAAGNGHIGTVGLLFAASAEVNARNNRGETALMIAVQYGHTETAQYLRTLGAC